MIASEVTTDSASYWLYPTALCGAVLSEKTKKINKNKYLAYFKSKLWHHSE